ncbi:MULTISPECIES: hypothetical protein [Methylobacterium]|uniref:Uncharacterized protein n=1 Tax=Methylobacterium ajmalii TaxID=2738439 RepID=A0ABU9ZT33_9HYPH|nr:MULTISPECIES: hypothetical protein [Methylobacterium]
MRSMPSRRIASDQSRPSLLFHQAIRKKNHRKIKRGIFSPEGQGHRMSAKVI